jgi:hypothetical protein
VTDPQNTVIYSRTDESQAKYSETAYLGGQYAVCFENTSANPIEINFNVLKGVAAKDYSQMATTKDIQDAEIRLKKINDSTAQIHREI